MCLTSFSVVNGVVSLSGIDIRSVASLIFPISSDYHCFCMNYLQSHKKTTSLFILGLPHLWLGEISLCIDSGRRMHRRTHMHTYDRTYIYTLNQTIQSMIGHGKHRRFGDHFWSDKCHHDTYTQVPNQQESQ